MSLLPFDLTEIIHEELMSERREHDTLMHASSHMAGSLRHAQLDVAGAPRQESELLNEITLKTGTFWHEWIHNTLRRLGVFYAAEVNLNSYLPPGWGGTLDGLFWHPELKAWVLIDFKTTKGEAIRFLMRDGAKEEHKLQTSLYWHAVRRSGITLAKKIGVFYLPKNDTRSKDELIEPMLIDFDPYPQRQVMAAANSRRASVDAYLESLPESNPHPLHCRDYITSYLEPVQERTQRIFLDRATGTYDVKLMPHWSAAYCPFPVELCDCSTQGQTKVGFYDTDGSYIPRKGYEHIKPEVEPPA